MKKIIFVFLLLISCDSFAQQVAYNNLFSINTSDNSLFNELSQYADDYKIINVNLSDKNSILSSKPENLNINFPVSSSESINLNLKKFEIFTRDVKIIEKSANGEIEANVKNSFAAYTGTIPGMENSLVTLTMGNDEVRGILITKTGTYVLGKIKDNRASESDYVLYQTSKMKASNPFRCYTGDEDLGADVRKKLTEMNNDNMGNNIRVAQIALEVDFITYNIYESSTVNTTNYVMSIMTTVSAIYLREVRTKLEVPYLRIWTTQDSYNGTSSGQYLNQFKTLWNSTMSFVPRTVAHFISRRPGFMGGIAGLNVLCSSLTSGNGYGFTNTTGLINNFPVYSWDIMGVTHELGHNFGSPHTHDCSWPGGPIDSCSASEGGNCYTGPPVPRSGTIMSYCQTTPAGIDLDKGFGTLPKNLIRTRCEQAGCITNSSQQLIVTYPVANMVLNTQSNFRIMWAAANSGGTVNLSYTTNNGSSWNPIASNINSDLGYYNWSVPNVQTSAQSKIRIVDSSNPSIADTSDAFTIHLQFAAFNIIIYPIQFMYIQTSPTNSSLMHFTWTRPSTFPGLQYKLRLRKVGNFPDHEYLSNNNGNDTVASLRISQLDSLAALITSGDSVLISARALVFTNLDSLLSSNSVVISIKRTTVGIQQTSEIIPDKFALYNNFPNPFNPTTNIKFDVPELSNVKISIYDINGKEVATLVNNQMSAGSYTADWNASNFSSGVYFYRMTTDKFVETKKMMMLK